MVKERAVKEVENLIFDRGREGIPGVLMKRTISLPMTLFRRIKLMMS